MYVINNAILYMTFFEKITKNDNQACQNLKIDMLFYTLKNQIQMIKTYCKTLITILMGFFKDRILPTTNSLSMWQINFFKMFYIPCKFHLPNYCLLLDSLFICHTNLLCPTRLNYLLFE